MKIKSVYLKAHAAGLVSHPGDTCIRSAAQYFARNKREPGDCGHDEKLLAGLAVAECELGNNYPGWILRVQALGVKIAGLL